MEEKRIDFYPTHRHGDFKLRPGRPFPYGATLVPGGVNFSVMSRVTDKMQPSPSSSRVWADSKTLMRLRSRVVNSASMFSQ